jgi:hypothetical protein
MAWRAIKILLFVFAAFMTGIAQNNKLTIGRASRDFDIADLRSSAWKDAKEFVVDKNWDGSTAVKGRQFRVRLLWSDSGLYIRCEAGQTEALIISEKPILDSKTMNLWDRDVCEIFIAPDRKKPRKYFEFEVAPTGEWIDLAIDLTSGKRETDWKYNSGMESAAKIETGRVIMAIRIPWTAFGTQPKAGDVWLGNLFRCVGKDPTRGYLAWKPTLTKEPSFHVPEKFGEFRFEN